MASIKKAAIKKPARRNGKRVKVKDSNPSQSPKRRGAKIETALLDIPVVTAPFIRPLSIWLMGHNHVTDVEITVGNAGYSPNIFLWVRVSIVSNGKLFHIMSKGTITDATINFLVDEIKATFDLYYDPVTGDL